jgi:hypothetical protein
VSAAGAPICGHQLALRLALELREERDREAPCETWPTDQKDAIIAQLEPMVKLYNRLTA